MLEKTSYKKAPPEIVNALVKLYQNGQFEDVLSRSPQLIKEYPDTLELHNILGTINFIKGNKKEAL